MTLKRNEGNRLKQDQLMDEYKLIQAKIDHIGGFKFRVRGWSVTLISALLLAIASSKVQLSIGAGCFWVLIALIVIGAFRHLELEQVLGQHELAKRARFLERALSVGPRARSNRAQKSDSGHTAPVPSPRIAALLQGQRSWYATARPCRLFFDDGFFCAQLLIVAVMVAGVLFGVFEPPGGDVAAKAERRCGGSSVGSSDTIGGLGSQAAPADSSRGVAPSDDPASEPRSSAASSHLENEGGMTDLGGVSASSERVRAAGKE